MALTLATTATLGDTGTDAGHDYVATTVGGVTVWQLKPDITGRTVTVGVPDAATRDALPMPGPLDIAVVNNLGTFTRSTDNSTWVQISDTSGVTVHNVADETARDALAPATVSDGDFAIFPDGRVDLRTGTTWTPLVPPDFKITNVADEAARDALPGPHEPGDLVKFATNRVDVRTQAGTWETINSPLTNPVNNGGGLDPASPPAPYPPDTIYRVVAAGTVAGKPVEVGDSVLTDPTGNPVVIEGTDTDSAITQHNTTADRDTATATTAKPGDLAFIVDRQVWTVRTAAGTWNALSYFTRWVSTFPTAPDEGQVCFFRDATHTGVYEYSAATGWRQNA